MLNVLFQSREDFLIHPGGDSTQLLKTKAFLEKLGSQVDVSTDSFIDLSRYDLIHVFNITGACQTTLFQILNAKKQKKMVVLSPIYWNGLELQKIENRIMATTFAAEKKLGLSYLKCLTISLLKSMSLRRVLDTATLLRDRLRGIDANEFKARIAFGERTIQAMCLELANMVLPNSTSEANLIVRDFGLPLKKMVVIPNGVDLNFLNSDPTLFKNTIGLDTEFVLSVANVGSRKNTLALIQALRAERIPLVLIGSTNPTDIYCKLCIKAAKNGLVKFLGKIPHDSPMLASAYAAAKVHAQVSWFETPGLSSLEAALAGCNVVVSDRGSTRDYFENYAWYCNPAEVSSIRKAISEAYSSPKKLDLKLHVLSKYAWEKVAEKTLDAYQKMTNDLSSLQYR